MSSYTQKVVAINNFGLQERLRTSTKTGKESVRFTVRIDATPLLHYVDTHELSQKPAEAIAAHLRARVANIQEPALGSTLATRANAFQGVQRGEDWALARYSRGRGTFPPGNVEGGRKFNDSGRLAAGIVARKGDRGEWVVNVPASRLNPETLGGGRAALESIYQELIRLVPEFADMKKLYAVGTVKEAILDGYATVLRKNADLRSRLARTKRAAFASALSLFTSRL